MLDAYWRLRHGVLWMEPDDIKSKIEAGLPGAKVEVLDPMNDGVHLKACVYYAGFAGKKLLEQHRMVMELLKEELRGELHALALETRSIAHS